jgi:putative Ig domain-containing protein
MAALALAVAAGSAGPARADQPVLTRVMIIGDSVATGMYWHNDAITIVQNGFDVDWEVEICRRLTGQSCTSDGVTPPTALDLVDSLSSVPPYVVMVMGYNDPADTFAQSLDTTMQALVSRGAQHVLWLTLRESEGPYPLINQQLGAALARWPQLRLVDWNAVSADHPEWFQNDFVHLVDAGGAAMARLVHGSLMEEVDPLKVDPLTVPALRYGRVLNARLDAQGGTPPYRWRVASGRPPRGIHLATNGQLSGRPWGPGPRDFTVSVTDADGLSATTTLRARS